MNTRPTCIVPANSRGGRVLVHDGYRYMRKGKSNTTLRWTCTESTCRAILHTNLLNVYDDNAVITGKFSVK
jgi:FLYWCH zinc finger domain